jgi:Ca2+-binding RTX toxin-like protein
VDFTAANVAFRGNNTTGALDQVFNSGIITGDAELRAGDDLYDGRGGRIIGTVDGGNGNDALIGGDFADTLQDGFGANWIVGGGDDDMVLLDFDLLTDTVFAGEVNGTDDSANDTVSFTGGGAVNIYLGAGFVESTTAGLPVIAWITGFENAEGSFADDAIIGDANNNRIEGDDGSDWQVGGRGADTFVYRDWQHVDNDNIRDFSDLDQDVIDLSAIDADFGTAGNQDFSLVASHTNNAAAEIVVTDFGVSAIVEFYVDANNTVDATLVVVYEDAANTTLGADDFIL